MFRTLSITAGTLIVLALATTTSYAGMILTDPAGYTGPVLDLSPFAGTYAITFGPVSLPGGITFTSNPVNPVIPGGSLIGQYPLGYFLTTNGGLDGKPVYIGLNAASGFMTLTFSSPVKAFGTFMNYAPFPSNADPTIIALDGSGHVLDSFDLASTAPISTPNQTNRFVFRGISEDSAVISSFELAGSAIVAAGTADGELITPEPRIMLQVGLGLAGICILRNRSAKKISGIAGSSGANPAT